LFLGTSYIFLGRTFEFKIVFPVDLTCLYLQADAMKQFEPLVLGSLLLRIDQGSYKELFYNDQKAKRLLFLLLALFVSPRSCVCDSALLSVALFKAGPTKYFFTESYVWYKRSRNK
jgi:hypothetical protein